MKTNVKKLMTVLAVAAMTACQEKDLYQGTTPESPMDELNQISVKAEYTYNFSKKYPNVNLNQKWDYSTKQSDYTLPAGRSAARTRAGEGNYTSGSWYEVDNNTLSWMHEQLVEGVDNRALGHPFYMSVPATEFTVVPIFQGQAGAMWNLHVVIDGVDYLIWEKMNAAHESGTGTIQIKDLDSDEWHNMHGEWYDWGYANWNSLYNTDGSDRHKPDWSDKNNVTAVRAIPFTFSGFRVGAEMYFYLDVTVSGNGEWDGYYHVMNEVGAHESSLKGQMLALSCPTPGNVPAGYKSMIIGCEDSDLKDSDWDMNDLVLLVYGQEVPQPVKIEEGTPIDEVKTVRYMIEDLGATDDFDFNDIVVDVSEIRTLTPTYTNGVVTAWAQTGYRQEAVIRHLGGVLPFRLKIGNTQLAEHQGVLGADISERYDVSGWDINGHNISVEVQSNGNETVYNNVTFPKAGEAPMIIAVDPSQGWMGERQSVPESWFYIPE